MPRKSVFQSQLEDEEVRRELQESQIVTEALREIPRALTEAVGAEMNVAEAIDNLGTARTELESPNMTEAIVMRHGYPSLLVRNGDYEPPQLTVWRRRLDPHREAIKRVIAGVGRVELVNHPQAKWVGTCWLVDENTLVTNRHVADFFTDAVAGRFDITRGVKAYVDFREEHLSDEQLEYLIASVSYIEMLDPRIDLALMKLDPKAANRLDIEPIPIAVGHDRSEYIGVVGYPARDSRNPVQDMARIFRDIYDVKRFAPGTIMDPQENDRVFTHNCTTLGGNSGSTVFDIQTGQAIGLHFAGSALDANFALNTHWLRDRLTKQSVRFRSGAMPAVGEDEEEEYFAERREENFDDRDGYRADFIGRGGLRVPLPRVSAMQAGDIAVTRDGHEIVDYRHFSVVLSRRRRLAYFAAANVDGNELRRPRRVGFLIEPRLDREQQADNDLYRGNDFDRGHLIRRLDPCWGSSQTARQANRDSMFYTNIAPQHKHLNQRLWLDLEEHILDNTDEENARISVFVGCVFDEDDPVHEPTGIRVPMGFWKIVASSTRRRRGRSQRRRLQAQAFILSQDHLVDAEDLGRELIFGGVPGVKQVTVEELERITGLDFQLLREADTFGMEPDVREQLMTEAMESGDQSLARASHYKPIESLADIVV